MEPRGREVGMSEMDLPSPLPTQYDSVDGEKGHLPFPHSPSSGEKSRFPFWTCACKISRSEVQDKICYEDKYLWK